MASTIVTATTEAGVFSFPVGPPYGKAVLSIFSGTIQPLTSVKLVITGASTADTLNIVRANIFLSGAVGTIPIITFHPREMVNKYDPDSVSWTPPSLSTSGVHYGPIDIPGKCTKLKIWDSHAANTITYTVLLVGYKN